MIKIISYLIFVILSTCEKNYSPIDGNESPILFVKYFINYAWGFQYSGWYIDNNGLIYEIDINTSLKFQAEHDSLFSKATLNELLVSSIKTNRILNKNVQKKNS